MKLACALATMLALLVAAGCSGGTSDVSKSKDEEIRDNMKRSLTAEEIAKMGGSSAPGPAQGPSDKKKPAAR